jgi:hypothetical protein
MSSFIMERTIEGGFSYASLVDRRATLRAGIDGEQVMEECQMAFRTRDNRMDGRWIKRVRALSKVSQGGHTAAADIQ